MKKILIILAILFSASSLNSISFNPSDDNVLNLSGYKVGAEDMLRITITDAIPGSLNVVDFEGEIDVSQDIDNLLGIVSDSNSFDQGKIVFSYRVAGNITGSFVITMTFTDLLNGTFKIPTVYNLGHLSYSFPATASNASGGYTIGPTSSESNVLVSLPGDTGLKSAWSVSPSS